MDNIINQLEDLNIKFNNYLIELQAQLNILNNKIIISRQQIIDNERNIKVLKQHIDILNGIYNIYY